VLHAYTLLPTLQAAASLARDRQALQQGEVERALRAEVVQLRLECGALRSEAGVLRNAIRVVQTSKEKMFARYKAAIKQRAQERTHRELERKVSNSIHTKHTHTLCNSY
jgi:hypothetical protein